LQPRARWNGELDDWLRDLYPNHPTAKIALFLGLRPSQVYNRAKALELKKSATYLASPEAGRLTGKDTRGGSTRFQKGNAAWNKGTKGIVGVQEACRATQFKPGIRQGVAVKLYQPIGTERVSKDGYLERKTNDGLPLQKRWRAVHLLVWEDANGPIPSGHKVSFKDGDKRNVCLDNLELLSNAEMMKRNTRHNLPPEVNEVIQLRAVLTRHINKRSKDHEQEHK
jgi:hypothetical protein